jgi:hypothetical protein
MAVPSIKLRSSDYMSPEGGEFQAVVTGAFDGNPVGNTFQTFCLELNETVWLGNTFYVKVNTGAVNGGVAGQTSPNFDPLDPRTAWLYNEFLKGTLAGYDYTDTAGRVASATALQDAIWYIEEEKPVVNDAAMAFVTLANDDGWKEGIGSIRVLNLYNDRELTSNAQDVLCQIPAPAAILLLGVGTTLVGALRRRFVAA